MCYTVLSIFFYYLIPSCCISNYLLLFGLFYICLFLYLLHYYFLFQHCFLLSPRICLFLFGCSCLFFPIVCFRYLSMIQMILPVPTESQLRTFSVSGGGMEYGVIGTSDQSDTKDGLEELCPVCGDKARLYSTPFTHQPLQ